MVDLVDFDIDQVFRLHTAIDLQVVENPGEKTKIYAVISAPVDSEIDLENDVKAKETEKYFNDI